ncbi:MAG: VanZ family protein [Syntrophomonadaceae bacterium]|nr:VanZ family protein [Syntrophomonadaceae bacterium]
MTRSSIFWIGLTIAWMGLIFLFSAQPADESSALSRGLIYSCLDFIVPRIDAMTALERAELIDALHNPVRKAAHAFIYCVLGLLVCLSVRSVTKPVTGAQRRVVTLSFIICALYAISDEVHQYYVPGRSMELRDMAIDIAGAAIGVAAIHILNCRRQAGPG